MDAGAAQRAHIMPNPNQRSLLPLVFLLTPVLIFAAFTLKAIQLQSDQIVDVSRQAVLRQANHAIEEFQTSLSQTVSALAQTATRSTDELATTTPGPFLVYVQDAQGKLIYPRSAPAPAHEEPVDDRSLGVLLRAQVRWEGAASVRALARLALTGATDRVRASALLRMARGVTDPAEALYYLHLLMDRYPGARDITGIAIGPVAALLAASRERAARATQVATAHLLDLLQDLTYRRFPLDEPETQELRGRVLGQIHDRAVEEGLSQGQRRRLRSLEDDPHTAMQGHLAAWLRSGPVDGRVETIGRTPYVVFARKVGQNFLVALGRVESMKEALGDRLSRIDAEGCLATLVPPAEGSTTYEIFTPLNVPHLDLTVWLLQDRQRLESLGLTRRRIMIAGVLLALSAFALGGMLIARDVRVRLELAQLKSEFVANMSHELKTPLTAIRMYAETLFYGRCRNEKRRDYMGRILRESKHLAQLIDNVLQLARADQARLDGRRSRVAVARLLADAVADVVNRWEGLEVQTKVPEALALNCDPELVTVALANVLDNAAKYGAPGRPIAVEARADGTRVTIAVTDEGRGIPAAEKDKVFERFFRASNAQDRKGMGIGLYLVHRIAEIHGGSVSFQSAQGQGSTLTLALPAAAEFVPTGHAQARREEGV